MEGLVVLDKPLGLTSARALDRVRTVTRQRKSGHAGTLDPLATGVLLICLGRATKLVEKIMDQPKVYRTTVRLDQTSDSFDLECETRTAEVLRPPTLDEVRNALSRFEGWTSQVPPNTSAVKIKGVPAYRRHARGQAIQLTPRPARIDWIHVHRYQWPELDIEIGCGRGVYVRSLVRDLGLALGVGGCLTALRRVRIGPFSLENAHTVEQLRSAESVEQYLIPLDVARTMVETVVSIPRPDVVD